MPNTVPAECLPTDLAPSTNPFVADASDVIGFDELVQIFDQPRSTVAAKVFAMEMVLDRVNRRLLAPPADSKARRQLVIVVPELGGLRMPGSTARFRRSWAVAYRDGGLPAAVRALGEVHSWLQNAREQGHNSTDAVAGRRGRTRSV